MGENIKEIIEKIEFYNNKFPKEELQTLISNQDESTPYLLELISSPQECLDKLWKNEDYNLPLYALFILAQFRETKAYPLIYDLFSFDVEKTEVVWGDFITEDFTSVLASVSGGDDSYIKKLIEDESVYEYVRTSAMGSLISLIKTDDIKREEVITYYQKLLQQDWGEGSFPCAALIGNCLNLRAKELMPEIKVRFEEEQVDELFIGDWSDVKKRFNQDDARFSYENSSRYDLVTDMVSDLEKWATFREKNETSFPPDTSPNLFDELDRSEEVIVWDSRYEGTYIREIPKVGKNDLCPCGSGFKYKKCCLL